MAGHEFQMQLDPILPQYDVHSVFGVNARLPTGAIFRRLRFNLPPCRSTQGKRWYAGWFWLGGIGEVYEENDAGSANSAPIEER